MTELFADVPEAISNTVVIAETLQRRCRDTPADPAAL